MSLKQQFLNETDPRFEDDPYFGVPIPVLPRPLDHPAIQSIYEPLPEGTIRLLHLLPGFSRQHIRCQLTVAKLADNPEYEAVSYAWGNPNLQTIFLNDLRTFTGHNLLACLRLLRYNTTKRVLWVDAICINQSDQNEKGSQVAIMADIYQSALKTWIWLGETPSWSPSFTLNRVEHDMHPWTFLQRLACDEHIKYNDETKRVADSLVVICNLDWWSRIWVVQETLLSRCAFLVLGEMLLPWDVAYKAALNFIKHSNTCCQFAKRRPGRSRTQLKDIITSMRQVTEVILSFRRVPHGSMNELLANLWMYRNRLATIDDDKIYGILGLLTSKEVALVPAYHKQFSEVCQSITLDMIKVTGKLHALNGSRTNTESAINSEQPSWCTDWSDLDYWTEDQARILTEVFKQIYTTSGLLDARIEGMIRSPQCTRLRLRGRIVDTVEHKMLPICDLGEIFSITGHLREMRHSQSYIAGGSVTNAVWRTAIGDCILPPYESQDLFHSPTGTAEDTYTPSIRRALPSDIFAFLACWIHEGNEFQVGNLLRRNSSPRDSHKIEDSRTPRSCVQSISRSPHRMFGGMPAVRRIQASATRASSGRRMFLTQAGYVGLGPENLQRGDRVAILLGGSTPFILRKVQHDGSQNEYWRVIGDCYVHGMMDGEMVKDRDIDNWPVIDLV